MAFSDRMEMGRGAERIVPLLVVAMVLIVVQVDIQGVAAQTCTRTTPCVNSNINCCSSEGYCGITAAHCGPGCKNGPCYSDNKGSGAEMSTILTKAVFERFFPIPPRIAFYTYEAFVTAGKGFPAFGRTGTSIARRRELAAFLANVHHETGGLKDVDEKMPPSNYCIASTRYPCALGKSYHGRGPLQLSHNYNYGAFGQDLSPNQDLLNYPERVANDVVLAFKAAVWFWMRGSHDAITRTNSPSFGETIKLINGMECSTGTAPNPEKVASRVRRYREFCTQLGVDPGSNISC